MASDMDVFSKLSRILETHEFGESDDAYDNIVKSFEPSDEYPETDRPGSGGGANKLVSTIVSLPNKPTPFEIWQAKQKANVRVSKVAPKMSTQQMDRMIGKMHRTNRTKQDTMIRVQNEGLKQELGGYEFKPRINKTSLELAATMKKLQERMPEMVLEREKFLQRKREDQAQEEIKECHFAPTREGSKTSDKYLQKMGRSAKARPEDFFNYQKEKLRRNELRKQVSAFGA